MPLEKLEVVASIAGGQLAIVFRNNISGITQKLGEIILNEDDKQELDIISWAGIAVQRSNELEDEVRELTSKYYEQSKMLESLNKQLDDLVQAKKRHEDTLLEKFRELLNTKKLKIRDQQRLLAGAKVDPKQAAKIESARSASRSHTPVASRASKRKAKAAASTSSSSDESSFQKKATKQKNESDNSGNMNTPDGSDQDVTEDESDEYLKAAPSQSTLPESNNCEIGGGKEEQMALDTPPPIRKLPFERSGIGRGKEQMKQPEAEDRSTMNQEAGNEDEETDDDEL